MKVLSKQPRYWAIIPAAGLGLRMGADRPKQYLTIHDKTILSYAVDCLTRFHLIEKVIVVLHADDMYWSQHNFQHGDKILTTVGGQTRAQSVLHGLQCLEESAAFNDWVCVHDAVRPCLQQELLKNLVKQLRDHPVGGLLGVPISDTLKITDDNGVIIKTLSRERVWQAQTPQLFRFGLLFDALKKALHDGAIITDEASAIEYVGKSAQMVFGSECNIKITRQTDLVLAESILSSVDLTAVMEKK